MIKSGTMRWAGHVDRMEEGRNAFKILTGTPTGKRVLSSDFHFEILTEAAEGGAKATSC